MGHQFQKRSPVLSESFYDEDSLGILPLIPLKSNKMKIDFKFCLNCAAFEGFLPIKKELLSFHL